MKKLFLIPLLALFTCVNMWGADVAYSDYGNMQAAVNAAGAGGKITISSSVTLNSDVDFNGCTIYVSGNTTYLTFGGTAKYENFNYTTSRNGARLQGNVTFEGVTFTTVNVTAYSTCTLTLQGDVTLPVLRLSANTSIINKTNVSIQITGTNDLNLTNQQGATFTFPSNTQYQGANLTIGGAGSIDVLEGALFSKATWEGCQALRDYCIPANSRYPEPWAVSGVEYVKVFATAQNHVAKIGAAEYPTLDAAAAAATENAIIDLTDDVNEAEVKISKNLTISGGTACKTLNCYFNITEAKTLKLINVAVRPTTGSYAVQLIKDSKLILSNAHIVGRSGNSAIKVKTSTANTTCQIESEAGTSNTIRNTVGTSTSTYTINGNNCVLEFMGNGDLLVEHKGTKGYLFAGSNGKFKLNAPNATYTYETASCGLQSTAEGALEHLQGIYSTVIESYEEGGHTVYPVSNANQLKLALNTASDNDVIRLNEDLIALKEQVVIDKTLTIDFRGCGLYSENMMNIDNLIKVGKDASSTNTVTFMSSGALEGGIYTYSPNAAAIEVYSNAIFERGLIENKHSYYTTIIDANHIELLNCHALRLHSGANVTINGGTFKSQRYAVYAKGDDASKDINLTINGGEFQVVNNPRSNAAAVAVVGNTESETAYNDTITINGGTFSGAYSGVNVLGKGAVLNVVGGTIDGNAVAIAGNGTANCGGTKINISGGTIGSSTTPVGIYHPQAGELNISGGTVTGLTAVAMKSGSLAMTDGTLRSTGEGTRVPGYNNGTYASAAALQIESNPSYAGSMDINIFGGKLESNSWYAVYEYTPEAQNPTLATEVNSIAISGGAHIGGILLSQSLAAKGGFVSGGKWTKDISANIKTGENLSLLNNEDDDNPPYLYLVGVPAPAQAEDYAEKDANNNAVLTNAASQSAAESYSSDNVGIDPDVIATKETNPVVVSKNTDVVATEAAPVVEVKKVTVDNNAQLTVTEGATLVVGAGAVTLDKTSSKGLTVEAGATLVVDGLIYGSTEDNFVIESQEGKSGIVLFSPETEFIREDHPKATYRFISKAFREGSKWVYQRFGVPTFDGHATIEWFNKPEGDEFKSWVKKWDYENDDWTSWTAFSGNQLEINDVPPFQGLMLASNNVKPDNTNPAMIYEFTGSLMGNSDANLHFYYGWNYYANSYTAPININEFIQTVKTSLGGSNDILATIYLYQDMGDDTYTWQAVNEFTAGSSTVVGFAPGVGPIYENVPSVINPMQAFLMRLNVEGEANQTIDYADNVYTPATTNTFNPAPARNRVTNNSMQISVFNANGNFDKVFFVENDNFSNDLDNGFDAYKYDGNKGVSLYAMSADKHMEILASNDVDGSFIGINAPEAGNYTLYFSGVQGMNYALIDMKNNTVVTIEEGGQFNFYAEAGQNDYRFQLVAPARVPTAVENVGAKAELKGIYTITGQYLGEDINALPKGVYIINGAKVVK